MSSRISLLLADGHTLLRQTQAHWLQGEAFLALDEKAAKDFRCAVPGEWKAPEAACSLDLATSDV